MKLTQGEEDAKNKRATEDNRKYDKALPSDHMKLTQIYASPGHFSSAATGSPFLA